jgi:hypothetical protein
MIAHFSAPSPRLSPPSGRQLQVTLGRENEKLDLFSIAMEFNLAYEKDSFRIPFSVITFD